MDKNHKWVENKALANIQKQKELLEDLTGQQMTDREFFQTDITNIYLDTEEKKFLNIERKHIKTYGGFASKYFISAQTGHNITYVTHILRRCNLKLLLADSLGQDIFPLDK